MSRSDFDPELMGPDLELSARELAPIADRYLERRVLLVGRPGLDIEPLREELTSEGWEVTDCPGPGKTTCPLMTGTGCDIRDEADAAIVFIDAHRGSPSALLPRLRCAAHGSPVVIAFERSVAPPEIHGNRATVGAARGSSAITETLASLRERILAYGAR